MENAAKALLIAGSVLLGIIVLSIFMIMVNSLTDYQQAQTQIEKNQDIVAFNNQFQGYMRSDLAGTDILSLINKVTYYNKAKASDAIGADDAGNQYVYEPITLVINMNDNNSDLAMDGNNNLIFVNSKFTIKGDTSELDNNLSVIRELLKNTLMPKSPTGAYHDSLPGDYNSIQPYYSEGILKALLENYNSTESIFIARDEFNSLSEAEIRQRFRSFNIAVGKTFFPLINKDNKPINIDSLKSWWNDYFDKSRYTIQKDSEGNTIEKELAYYYEYAQFQRGKFEFVQPGAGQETYSSNTGRVKYMEFKFTGEFI